MSRIARSDDPLFQTRGRPVSWPIRLTQPDGTALDLTGATASAALRWPGALHPLNVVGPLDDDGVITVSGLASLTATLPEGRLAELHLRLLDSLGAEFDFVWPVVGEIP